MISTLQSIAEPFVTAFENSTGLMAINYRQPRGRNAGDLDALNADLAWFDNYAGECRQHLQRAIDAVRKDLERRRSSEEKPRRVKTRL